jgi:hypothetical protein
MKLYESGGFTIQVFSSQALIALHKDGIVVSICHVGPTYNYPRKCTGHRLGGGCHQFFGPVEQAELERATCLNTVA